METTEIKQKLLNTYFQRFPEEVAGVLNSATDTEILSHLQNQSPEICIKVLMRLSGDVVSSVLEKMEDPLFIDVFTNIDTYTAALLISRLKEEVAEQKLTLFPEKLANEIKELLTYPAESAGFLMDTRIVTFPLESSVEEVLKKLRKLKDRRIVNIYIVDNEGRLLGLVPLQVIAVSSPDDSIKDIMEKASSVLVMSSQEEVVEILKDRTILGLPVVDMDNKLLGIIRHDALIKAAQQDAIEDVQAIFGAGREERALSKVSFAIRKRLPWLEINLATAFLAASVVGIFEETIAKITVLAVFLPVVAGQSGNTGSQALAVTIRGLALRELRMSQWWQLARKEVAVGFFNGVVVALSTSIIVYFWASSIGLAIVIGTSMVFSMVIAGFSGAVIPILLKSIGQDPAQSSSIILTTVTDIVGFMSFLGLATILSNMIGAA